MASIPPIEVRLQLQIDELKSQIRSTVGELDKLREAQQIGGTTVKALTAEYQKQLDSIKNQTTVLQSQSALLQAQANLVNARTQKELALADTAEQRFAIEQRAAQQAIASLNARQQKETALFNLQQQRVALEAKLAVESAKAAVEAAKISGATQGEIAALRQQVTLQEKNQAAIARSSQLQREAFQVNQQVAKEQANTNLVLVQRREQTRLQAEAEARLAEQQRAAAQSQQDAIAQQISAYQLLGQVATQVFSAIRAAAGSVIAETAEFSRQITTVGAINTTSSQESLAALADEAVRLGTITSKSPQQVAGAAVSLSRLGFTANQVNQNLGGLVLAAEATQGSVESAADVVGASVKIYGDFADGPISAAKSADIFAATLNNTGVSSLDEFNQLLSKAGGTGKATGQDLVTLATAFGALRSAGTSAEVAGTALKTVLNSLSAPSTEAAAALNQLGINTRDSATGEMKNLLDLLPEINDALQKVSPGERDQFQQAIFGARGGPAALILMGQTRESLQSLRETIDQNGVAADTAGKLVDKSFSGALVLFTSSIQTATLAIGQSLEPALNFVTRRGVDLLNAFIAIPGPIKAFGAAAALAAAGVAGLTAAATAYLVVQQSGTIALAKEGAALVLTTAKKAAYIALTGGTATAAAAQAAAQNLGIVALVKEAAATGLATVNKLIYTTTTGGMVASVVASVTALNASAKAFLSQAAASVAAAGGMKAIAGAAFTALAPLALLAAAAFLVKNAWDIATAGFEQKGALDDAAAAVDKFNAKATETEAAAEASTRATQKQTEAYGHQVGILNINNRAQLENQRIQKGLTNLLESTNGTIDATSDLFNQYGLNQVDAGDRARLGSQGIDEFSKAALSQKEAIENSISALEQQRGVAATDEQTAQIDAQIAVLQKNKVAINDRLNALGIATQTEEEVTDTLAATEAAIASLNNAYSQQTAAVELLTATKRAQLAEGQVAGTVDDGQAARELAQAEQDALEQRLAANQAYQAELRALVAKEGAGTQAGQLAAQKLLEVETESQELRTQVAENQIAERQRLEEEALSGIDANSERRIAQIEAAGAAELEAIKRSLLAGKITREEAAAQEAELDAKTGEQRLSAIQQEQAELAAALQRGTISREEYEARSLELSKEAQDARLEQLDAEIAAQEEAKKREEEAAQEAVDKITKIREDGDAAISQSIAQRELAIQQALLSGVITEEEAAARGTAAAKAEADQKVALAQQELAAIEEAARKGILSEEEAAKRKTELNTEVIQAQTDAVKAALAEQKAAQEAAIASIEQASQAAIASLQNQSAALSQQNGLLDAQASVLDALTNLSKTRAGIAASFADSELERAQIEQQAAQDAQAALAGRQAQELKILEIKQRQAALEAEIATRTAEANLAKARAAGASEAEIAALQQIVSLQRANEAAIAQGAELTRQATEINQQAAREQAAADVELARRKVQQEEVKAEDERIKLQREAKALGKEATPEDRTKQLREDIARTQELAKSGAISQGQAAERLRGLDAGDNAAAQRELQNALKRTLEAQQAPTAPRAPTPPTATEAPDTNGLRDAINQLTNSLQRPNISIESVSPVEDVLELQQRR